MKVTNEIMPQNTVTDLAMQNGVSNETNDDKLNRGGVEYPLVEILWTGGFDSTFRIVQLSRFAVRIQPYYVSDNRKSELNELNAIRSITELLKNHKDTKCVFLDLMIVKTTDRIQNTEITNAWVELRKRDYFGTQYDWLGSFSIQHKGIELSIHKDDKAILLIEKYGALKKVSNQVIGDYWIIDEQASDPYIITLFKNYHLPLADWTKLKMKEFYLANGYVDIMNQTWFCFNPIKGKPCGYCNPCMYTIEEGMKERFTKNALFKYNLKRLYNAIKPGQ